MIKTLEFEKDNGEWNNLEAADKKLVSIYLFLNFNITLFFYYFLFCARRKTKTVLSTVENNTCIFGIKKTLVIFL